MALLSVCFLKYRGPSKEAWPLDLKARPWLPVWGRTDWVALLLIDEIENITFWYASGIAEVPVLSSAVSSSSVTYPKCTWAGRVTCFCGFLKDSNATGPTPTVFSNRIFGHFSNVCFAFLLKFLYNGNICKQGPDCFREFGIFHRNKSTLPGFLPLPILSFSFYFSSSKTQKIRFLYGRKQHLERLYYRYL